MVMAALVAFVAGVPFTKSLTVPTWSMAAAAKEDVEEEEFDAMVAKLKSRQQPESKGFGAKKEAPKPKEPTAAGTAMKQVVEDVPEDFGDEELFVETKPSIGELVVPIIGTFFVIGIPPLMVGLVRQLWVKYKITTKRVQITSGWGGNEYTEVSFKSIRSMKYVRRNFGQDGDLVMELKGGGAVDMQSVPNFAENYKYIFDKVSPEAQEASMKPIN
jgi:hypothetical protein